MRAKTNHSLGKEYFSEKTGKKMPARKVRGPCQCANNCYDKVLASVRDEIHRNFWALGSYSVQNSYLSKLVKSQPIKRRCKPVQSTEKFCRHTLGYSVFHGDGIIPVCKIAFLNISVAPWCSG